MVQQPRTNVANLRSVLVRLAAPASEQIAYLGSLGVLPCADELALELDDELYRVSYLLGHGRLTVDQAEAIYAVERKLAEMSDRPELWDEAALRDHPDWGTVRRLAAASARELDATR